MGGKCSSEVPVDDSGPVSAQDKTLVRMSWQKVYRNWEKQKGTDFFLRLFKNQPAIKSKFGILTHLSEDEFMTSPALRAHVIVFGATVNSWVEKLDETDTLVALIQKTTDSHVVRGITDVSLLKIALNELLGFISESERLSPAHISSWTKIANLIGSVIEDRVTQTKG